MPRKPSASPARVKCLPRRHREPLPRLPSANRPHQRPQPSSWASRAHLLSCSHPQKCLSLGARRQPPGFAPENLLPPASRHLPEQARSRFVTVEKRLTPPQKLPPVPWPHPLPVVFARRPPQWRQLPPPEHRLEALAAPEPQHLHSCQPLLHAAPVSPQPFRPEFPPQCEGRGSSDCRWRPHPQPFLPLLSFRQENQCGSSIHSLRWVSRSGCRVCSPPRRQLCGQNARSWQAPIGAQLCLPVWKER